MLGKYFLQNQTMDILSNSLNALSLRHKTISNNIANINTPNYKRQLVSFEEEMQKHFNNSGKRINLKQTQPGHIGLGNGSFVEIRPHVFIDKTTSLRTDENNVDIDLELAALAENTIKFNALSQAISKKFSILRSVIRGGK